MDIAIIGAGMAGLTCAGTLSQAGHDVLVFDKGRGPGGRMSTRRMRVGEAEFRFDHGAQYFTARDPRFAAKVAIWEKQGVVARWPAAGDDAWVGTPGMNAPIKAMANEVDASFATRASSIRAEGKAYWIICEDGQTKGPFDAVLIAVPAEQAAPLALALAPDIAEAASSVASLPCWTVMAAFETKLDAPDVIRAVGPIGWAARNSAKPGRGEQECWVIQGAPAWSAEHLEDRQEAIEDKLLAALSERVGHLPRVLEAGAHRWRFANVPDNTLGAIWNADTRIGACGDWLLGPRVENAFLSGLMLGEKVLGDG